MARLRDRIIRRLAHAWNVFDDQDRTYQQIATSQELGPSYSVRPDRPRLRYIPDKTIISAIYTRLAIDVAAVPIRHVRLDDNKQYQEEIDSGLTNCLTVEANIDQGARHFRQDVAQTLFDDGVAAIVATDTTLNPLVTGGYDVVTMRVGRVIQWYPQHVQVRVYNQAKGLDQDILLPKGLVAIIENPLYAVMNEKSSTLQRLVKTLALLDSVDEQSASGKLDIIIQLPYTIRSESRKAEADKRVRDIELQLKGSQYGIAYADSTERITQLNRPAENNLMSRVEYLTKMLYGQLGLTEEVMNGTADEPTMINYYNRSIEPVLAAITEAMARVFLTKTARTQGQAVIAIRDPFKLVPVTVLADLADKLTRNEIASSNDMRSVIGWRPSKDPKADKLLNKNIPAAQAELPTEGGNARILPPAPPRQLLPMRPPPIQQGVTSQNGT